MTSPTSNEAELFCDDPVTDVSEEAVESAAARQAETIRTALDQPVLEGGVKDLPWARPSPYSVSVARAATHSGAWCAVGLTRPPWSPSTPTSRSTAPVPCERASCARFGVVSWARGRR